LKLPPGVVDCFPLREGKRGGNLRKFLDNVIRLASRCFYGLCALSKKPSVVGHAPHIPAHRSFHEKKGLSTFFVEKCAGKAAKTASALR